MSKNEPEIMNWKRVTIFISSTFNDMHAERDYLVKDVFPELREWCEARKIHLVDVDLRWGVTEEDAGSNHTVLACLHNIDESRPFFLCFLGQRRGWVPGKGDVSAETMVEYPGIANVVGHSSVTEMEIEHALLAPMRHIVNGIERHEVPVGHALFYFRKPEYLKDLSEGQRRIFTNEAETDVATADSELAKFKEKVRSQWNETLDYDCSWDSVTLSPELPEGVNRGRLAGFGASGRELKDIIVERLQEEIVREFPDREKVEYASPLERDLDQQALFTELSSEGFISRAGDFFDLNDYIAGAGNGLFVLTATAGSGKSMLLANFIVRESHRHRARFFNRFCGVSDLCSQQFSLWKTIFDEAGVKCPDTFKELKDKISELLAELAKDKKTVLIIDAINQLPGGEEMLEWLPKQLPANLRIILSIKTNEGEKPEAAENTRFATVKPFTAKEEKRKLINDYLRKYLKALDEGQIDAICSLDGSQNPLYLKVLLSELRVFGSFAGLSQQIGAFGRTPLEAFAAVLRRLESDVNSLGIDSARFAPLLFGLLAAARNGLSEEELTACIAPELGLGRERALEAVRLFVRQMRPFMARREGRADYFYEAFKLAARARYESSLPRLNALLANYFRAQADPDGGLNFKGANIRDFNELPYHLAESGSVAELGNILATYLWIRRKSELSDIQNVIGDYACIDAEKEENYHLKMLRDVLVMSAHLLSENIKDNLPSQLWGRLKEIDNARIKEFLTEIDTHTTYLWLKPQHRIQSPEGALKITIQNSTEINSICCSNDSKYIAVGYGRGDYSFNARDIVTVWDWLNQKKVFKITGIGSAHNVCFSYDGKYLAYLRTGTIFVYDWEMQKEVHKFDTKGAIFNLCSAIYFSPNGEYLVAGTQETIRAWNLSTKVEVFALEGHTKTILSVAVSYDSRYIVSGSVDGTVRIWDFENAKKTNSDSKKQIQLLQPPHGNSVNSVQFSPCGKYVVLSTSGHGVNIVSVLDWRKKEILFMDGYRTNMFSACFSPDGKYISAGLEDATIRIWDWENNMEINTIDGYGKIVTAVCFSKQGNDLFSGSKDGFIKVWNWRQKAEFRDITANATKISMSHDGKYVALNHDNNSLSVIDRENQKELFKIENIHFTEVCLSPDGEYVVFGGGECNFVIWDWKNQKEMCRVTEKDNDWVSRICFSSDSKLVAIIQEGKVRVWDWLNQTEICETIVIGSPYDICFSPDNRHIAICDASDKTGGVIIWNLENQQEVELENSKGRHMDVCFSSDGKYFVSGAGEIIQIWDWKTKKEICVLERKKIWGAYKVDFSTDGKYIVSGSTGTGNGGREICIWDWKSCSKPILQLTFEHNDSGWGIEPVFSKDMRYVVATAREGALLYEINHLYEKTLSSTPIIDLNPTCCDKSQQVPVPKQPVLASSSQKTKKKGFLGRLFKK